MRAVLAMVLGGAAAAVMAATAPAAASSAPASTVAAPAAAASRAAAAANAPARAAVAHVVLVGVGGLRWSDISPSVTPALWRLATRGTVGSLVVRGARQFTCPADDWLTLNSAARAAVPLSLAGSCPADPALIAQPAPGSTTPAPGSTTPAPGSTTPAPGSRTPTGAGASGPARIPAMPGLVSGNTQYSQDPQWGLLATAAGPAGCVTAAGPGAALALAAANGRVGSYLPSASALTRAGLARCPLTVVDLGDLPAGHSAGSREPADAVSRTGALRADDRRLAAIRAGLPAGTILMVAGLSDGGSSHLQALIVSGPGYRAGLIAASSTRQLGMAVITDVTPTVLHWLGRPVPAMVVGSQLRSAGRAAGPAATVRMLVGQDTAAQVYASTMAPFFIVAGFGYVLMFALIWAFPWGRGEERGRRRRAVARAAGLWAAAVPVGSFLASLVPWWLSSHPAALLYSLTASWAVAVAAIALAGPWRRDPLGPAGVVATVTLVVMVADLMTGSHLELDTPFGLPMLVAGRYYGLNNNAVVIYAASGALCAAWLASVALRRERRRPALAVMAAVLAVTAVVAGWPGFGAKVGGTVAMVPGFLVLLAVTAGVRITVRRALLIAVSGAAVVTVFALVNYAIPATGRSDIGEFVGQVLHGGAGSILRRKVGSNLHSLVENPFVPVIPVVVVALGAVLGWPARFRARLLERAYREIPLLRATMSAVWLIAVLGWFAEDSGATVPAAALPMLLPIGIAILSSVGGGPGWRRAPVASTAPAVGAGRDPAGQSGDRASYPPGPPGYR